MKNCKLFSILLIGLVCIHSDARTKNIPFWTRTHHHQPAVLNTFQQAIIGSCVVVGTCIAAWLTGKAYSTYNAYTAQQEELQWQYENRLDSCLPQKQIHSFDELTPQCIERLFHAICFDRQQNFYGFFDGSGFDNECQKAYKRIEEFKNHNFLNHTHGTCTERKSRIYELHKILRAQHINMLKAFALLRIIEKMNFFRCVIIPTDMSIGNFTQITKNPEVKTPQSITSDASYVASRLFNNNYIAAVACVKNSIEQCNNTQLYCLETPMTTMPIENAALRQLSTTLFQQIHIYREALLDLHTALIRDPLYQREIDLYNQERELSARIAAENQRAVRENQRTQALWQQAETVRQQSESIRRQTEAQIQAIRQQREAQEEHNRIEREKLRIERDRLSRGW